MADKSIRVALHGSGPSGFGLTKDGDVVSRNRLVAPYDNSKRVLFFDDFFGDVIADQWNFVQGSSTTSTAAVVNAPGGVVRLTTSATAGTIAADSAQLTQGAFYGFTADNGGLSFETRIRLATLTTTSVFVGFTDLGTFEAPIIGSGSGNGITTNATEAVGILYDTAMTTQNFWGVGVKNDVDATSLNLGVAPAANTYVILKVEVDATGAAKFFVNGQGRGGGVMSNAVTRTAVLTPTLFIAARATSARTLDADYVDVRMDRF